MIKIGLLLGTLWMPIGAMAATTGTVTVASLNIRNKPSMSGDVVKTVTYGTPLHMLGKEKGEEGWYKVQLADHQEAYVKEAYVTIVSVTGKVREHQLNFRSYPSLAQSKIITKLPKGAEVDILYKVGDFYKVLYNGRFGFVYADYIEGAFLEQVPLQDIGEVQEIQCIPAPPLLEENIIEREEQLVEESQIVTAISENQGLEIVAYGLQFVGNPYVYGGNDLMTGVDCSGYTQQVMKAFGIDIPRTSRDQSKVGQLIADRSAMQPGDLIFFGTSTEGINHVGIYAGGDYMIHAGTAATGITISQLNERGFSPLQAIRRMQQ